MKASVEKKYKAVSAVWAVLGFLFLIGALAMFLMRGSLPQIPRADIAYIGFFIVGFVFLIVAVSVYCMAKDKTAVVEENDERAQMISGKAGSLAFVVQTVLLSSALFLLCFMGFATAPVMITLMCLIAVSVFVYLVLVLYYNQKM
jgi:drug/metabolite transporter (DMT)-like permease